MFFVHFLEGLSIALIPRPDDSPDRGDDPPIAQCALLILTTPLKQLPLI
jgi:hypothetical protein